MSGGISASGSPVMVRVMRYLSGSSVITGRTFFATGLYFFLPAAKTGSGSGIVVDVVEVSKAADGSENEEESVAERVRGVAVSVEESVSERDRGVAKSVEESVIVSVVGTVERVGGTEGRDIVAGGDGEGIGME